MLLQALSPALYAVGFAHIQLGNDKIVMLPSELLQLYCIFWVAGGGNDLGPKTQQLAARLVNTGQESACYRLNRNPHAVAWRILLVNSRHVYNKVSV
jgi:hypothetical protein